MAKRITKEKTERLAKNFHLTFMPEKQYLGAMLKYAAGAGEYELQAIADETGIPTGKSSGKAIPTADYAIGMGLAKLQVIGEPKEKRYSLVLTNFGRAVYLGDRFFREELTQWIAHLNLCNAQTGAELWYQLFWHGFSAFGNEFNYEDFIKWVITEIGASDARKALGPTLGMYTEDASFSACGAIVLDKETGRATRKISPINPAYAVGYAAWMAELLERAGKMQNQLTVDELEKVCGFRSVTGWSLPESQQMLAIMEERGLITLDRHMQPWIVCFKDDASKYWTRIYEEFI